MGERERLALLRRIFGEHVGAQAESSWLVSIGDDAAVRAPLGDQQLVASVDAQVEGVHFERRWLSLADLGYRATMAALSDLAAMGARPIGVLSSLVLPPDIDDDQLAELARGQREAADSANTAVVGGNLARGPQLSISTTVLGTCERSVGRGGAVAGDALLLAGPTGLAAAALSGLQAEIDLGATTLAAWRRPRALIEEGLDMAGWAHACIDISDGLALDAHRLAEASGLALVLQASALVTAELAQAATLLEVDPLELALHGGEDYALLVAAPADRRPPGMVRVGGCEPGEAGLWLEHDGRREPLEPRGWDHFASVETR